VSAPDFTFSESVAVCDLCGGDDFRPVDPRAKIVECARCGYRFVNPRPSQDEIAAAYSNPHFYDAWLADDAGRRRMWEKRLELIRKTAPGPRLLDIGAGVGTFLKLARDQGWTVTGTEVSTAADKLAHELYGIDLLQGQAEDVDLPRGGFDVVSLFHVLEHVPSPTRLLRLCLKALVPGGYLVVAVPNDADSAFTPHRIKSRIRGALGRPWPVPERYLSLRPGAEIHLSHFRFPVLKRLLEKEGFQVRSVTVDDHYPAPNWKTSVRVLAYRSILRAHGPNFGEAMLVIARRQA
jgi:SAM-dependent methyltransferase